jgi:hypothetical protein
MFYEVDNTKYKNFVLIEILKTIRIVRCLGNRPPWNFSFSFFKKNGGNSNGKFNRPIN